MCRSAYNHLLVLLSLNLKVRYGRNSCWLVCALRADVAYFLVGFLLNEIFGAAIAAKSIIGSDAEYHERHVRRI